MYYHTQLKAMSILLSNLKLLLDEETMWTTETSVTYASLTEGIYTKSNDSAWDFEVKQFHVLQKIVMMVTTDNFLRFMIINPTSYFWQKLQTCR